MKEINIKNRPYYLFNAMINIKNFSPSLLGIDKLSCKSGNNIYHIEYMKKIIIEENNEDKYLISAFTRKNKEVLKNTQKLERKLKIK